MRRRLLLGLAGLLAGASPNVLGQAKLNMVRIGFMPAGPDISDQTWFSMLRSALGDLGYIEGRNLTLIIGRPDGTPAGMKAAVFEMARQQPNLVVTFGNEPVLAIRKYGMLVPVVMSFATDPLGAGLVGNLSKPGGLITGTHIGVDAALFAKQLALLRSMLPKLSRVVVLTSDKGRQAKLLKTIQDLAKPMGITVRGYMARDRDELASAFKSAKAEKAAIIAWGDYPQSWMRQQIGEYGLEYKVSVVAVHRGYVEVGALCSVGVRTKAQFEITARYIDRILNGARPGDLPIEIPTEFEHVINGRTAAALGITLSHELRLRADEILEGSPVQPTH
jgi:putative ABC transport system substrate-binding protein